jgi:hypothetical protein
MWIFEPEPKTSNCRSCGKPIVWAITTQGKTAPLVADYARNETKTIKLRTRAGVTIEVNIISVPERDSHFVDCPQRNQWRKKP